MQIPSLRDADVSGKRVLVHVDFDVPLDMTRGEPQVIDDFRIRAALPTLQWLREHGASNIILISKLGRPEGTVVESLRMAPIAAHLATLIDMTGIEMRENLRFDPREEANDKAYAKELASLGDIFVNESFADSHREHASIVGIPKFIPGYAGIRFEQEVAHMEAALTPPAQSLAIIGGAKFETKQPLLEKLASLYGTILLGGALANDLLKSRGLPIGASLTSDMGVPISLAQNPDIQEPIDLLVKTPEGTSRSSNTGDVQHDEKIVDIGARTVERWSAAIRDAEFVLWNGPTGIYEEGFVAATDALAEAIAHGDCRALIGGGDTVAALSKIPFDSERVFISTGGGAMLQFLAEGTLPGVEALRR
ncbi:MAG TPA: phosphoglycerate kinase [Candidatus Paceibacterota bacterium]|nr:phosphoglycerate kinase [Candidatus Paceibacterota bacterium]